MKKMLIIFAVTLGAVSCKTKSVESLDTQKEMVVTYPAYNNNATTDIGKATVVANNMPKPVAPKAKTVTKVYGGNSSNSNATASTTVKHKKGWSNRAKGAVIGGGTGAIIGAVVSKHKGTGAVIGALIGAGGGYVIGNEKDRKNEKNN